MQDLPRRGLRVRLTRLPLARLAGTYLARRLYSPPRRPHHRTPSDLGMDFVDDTLITADGIALHVWVIPPEGPLLEGIAIVGHGIGLTKSASLRQAKILHDAGYGVVMYDHRNHGRSASDSVRKGMAERFTLDIVAAAGYAQGRFHHGLPVLAYGFSFSTFPSVYAMRDSSAIGAVICDSGPCVDIAGLFDRFAAAGALPLPDTVLDNAWGRQMMQVLVSTATDLLDPVWPPAADRGGLDTTPMLLISGADDEIAPPSEGEAFAELYDGAVCVVLPGRHLDTVKESPEAYQDAVTGFLSSMKAPR